MDQQDNPEVDRNKADNRTSVNKSPENDDIVRQISEEDVNSMLLSEETRN